MFHLLYFGPVWETVVHVVQLVADNWQAAVRAALSGPICPGPTCHP